jgi:hypothetical protein
MLCNENINIITHVCLIKEYDNTGKIVCRHKDFIAVILIYMRKFTDIETN